MPHLCKLCNNLVKVSKSGRRDLHTTFMQAVQQLGEVSKSRRRDLHATFMQVVQQLGEGVEIGEEGSSYHIYAGCATTW
ncbi:hypothetical protein H5410_025822 [Solanum commersonii]|uniref:Uncharacterized protein n=1 Tax=Solanum commersonii TaxID=4109 RepID=A0A9J5YVA2_SOLCO|nr:hypothetical protein H5410_025822 [Solanum commersonii]